MSKIKIIISLVLILVVIIFTVKFFKSDSISTSIPKKQITVVYQAARQGNTLKNSCSYAPYGGLLREINAATSWRASSPGSFLYLDAGNSLVSVNKKDDEIESTATTQSTKSKTKTKSKTNSQTTKQDIKPLDQKDIEVASWIASNLSEAKLDALGIGGKDLNLSIPTLKQIESQSRLNMIASNIKDKNGNYPFNRFSIIESAGVRFGVISVSSDQDVNQDDIIIENPSTVITQLVEDLKDKTDFIILLAQMRTDKLEVLIANLPSNIKIDLAVVADTFFSTSKIFWLNQGKTLLANQDVYGYYIGKLNINYKTLPISSFSSPKQIEQNLAKIQQLEQRLQTEKNTLFLQKQLDNLKNNSELTSSKDAAIYEGDLIGLDSSFDTMESDRNE